MNASNNIQLIHMVGPTTIDCFPINFTICLCVCVHVYVCTNDGLWYFLQNKYGLFVEQPTLMFVIAILMNEQTWT